MSDLLPLSQFSYIVTDMVPNQDYVFQAVAREDKGILGKEWNKSPKAYFRTNKNSPTVATGLGASSHSNPSINIGDKKGEDYEDTGNSEVNIDANIRDGN